MDVITYDLVSTKQLRIQLCAYSIWPFAVALACVVVWYAQKLAVAIGSDSQDSDNRIS